MMIATLRSEPRSEADSFEVGDEAGDGKRSADPSFGIFRYRGRSGERQGMA